MILLTAVVRVVIVLVGCSGIHRTGHLWIRAKASWVSVLASAVDRRGPSRSRIV